MVRVRSPNDVFVGLFLIVAAAVALWLCRDLRLGSSVRMGPGYMPFALCVIMVGLGLISCMRGLTVVGEPAERWRLRPLLVISLSIAFYAFAIERLGLVLAIVGLVFIGSYADPETRRVESALLSVGLAVFCVLIFAKALGLPLQILPEGLR